MILATGSTLPLAIGPFLSASGSRVTSGTPTGKLYVNGVQQSIAGSLSAVDSLGYSKFTPAAADTASPGELALDCSLSGAVALCVRYQVGPPPSLGLPLPIVVSGSLSSGYAGIYYPTGAMYNGAPVWQQSTGSGNFLWLSSFAQDPDALAAHWILGPTVGTLTGYGAFTGPLGAIPALSPAGLSFSVKYGSPSPTGTPTVLYQATPAADSTGDPPGQQALINAGFLPLPSTTVATVPSTTQINTNWAYSSTGALAVSSLPGQIITFMSGPLAGQSFTIATTASCGVGDAYLALIFTATMPQTTGVGGSTIQLSNLVSATGLATALEEVPTLGEIIDQTGAGGSDGTPIRTIAGLSQINSSALVTAIWQDALFSLSTGVTTADFAVANSIGFWLFNMINGVGTGYQDCDVLRYTSAGNATIVYSGKTYDLGGATWTWYGFNALQGPNGCPMWVASIRSTDNSTTTQFALFLNSIPETSIANGAGLWTICDVPDVFNSTVNPTTWFASARVGAPGFNIVGLAFTPYAAAPWKSTTAYTASPATYAMVGTACYQCTANVTGGSGPATDTGHWTLATNAQGTATFTLGLPAVDAGTNLSAGSAAIAAAFPSAPNVGSASLTGAQATALSTAASAAGSAATAASAAASSASAAATQATAAASAASTIETAITANPTAVINALITAGVLQYLSGSSGPLQLSTEALALAPTGAAISISTQDVIIKSNQQTSCHP